MYKHSTIKGGVPEGSVFQPWMTVGLIKCQGFHWKIQERGLRTQTYKTTNLKILQEQGRLRKLVTKIQHDYETEANCEKQLGTHKGYVWAVSAVIYIYHDHPLSTATATATATTNHIIP